MGSSNAPTLILASIRSANGLQAHFGGLQSHAASLRGFLDRFEGGFSKVGQFSFPKFAQASGRGVPCPEA